MFGKSFTALLVIAVFGITACDHLPRSPQSRCASAESLDAVARTLVGGDPSAGPSEPTSSERGILQERALNHVRSNIANITLAEHDEATDRTVCDASVFGAPFQYAVQPALDRPGWVYSVRTNSQISWLIALELVAFRQTQNEGAARDPSPAARQPVYQGPAMEVPGAAGPAPEPRMTLPYYHNGPDATILEISGVGTSNARLVAHLTSADISRWCGPDADDPNCDGGWETSDRFSVQANCVTGRLDYSSGGFYQVIGRDEYGYVYEDSSGRLTASFNQDAAARFETLCPNPRFDNLPSLAEPE